MPRKSKQQELTAVLRQEKKIKVTSRYFKEVRSETNDSETRRARQREDDMKKLKEFDLNWEYGPCTGITRLERWERAAKHDLNPPEDIRDLILRHRDDNDYLQSLWKDYDL